ncbi:maltose-binding protein, partial [[Eubacterium] siraeum]|nr:maltose-binding protein [[Eubacterium] siraeum]
KDGPDEFIRKAGDSFHNLYPNITIEYVNVEIPDAIINLKDKNSTIKRPDLFASPCDMAGELIANDLILPTIDTSFVNTVAMTFAGNRVAVHSIAVHHGIPCESH